MNIYRIADKKYTNIEENIEDMSDNKVYSISFPQNKTARLYRKITMFLFSRLKLNHIYIPPFMYRKTLDDVVKYSDEKCIFVFREVTSYAYSKGFMKELKRRCKNARMVFCFANPIGKCNRWYVEDILNKFDYIVTFNKPDAEEYGYGFYEGIYEKTAISDEELLEAKESDLFFVGRNKGRIETLRKIYCKFVESGYRCNFFITEVDKSEISNEVGIHYNLPLTYSQVVAHVQKTKCILEVLQEGQVGASLRTMEAITYQKMLLTNNADLKNKPFYDPASMVIYNNTEEITPENVINNTNGTTMPSATLLYNKFVEYLIEKV